MKKLFEFNRIQYTLGERGSLCVSGHVEEGCILNVSGPSGTGKTTLLRILARLIKAGGEVFISGVSWKEVAPSVWRRRVHYLAQKPVLFDGTVKDNLAKPFELNIIKNEAVLDWDLARDMMERLQLSDRLLDQDARTISGGEASRIALIRSLLVEPEVLLLDEPLAALDKESAARVMDLVSVWRYQKAGRGVIIVSHVGEFEDIPGLSILSLNRGVGEAVE